MGPSAAYLQALLEHSPIATVVLDHRHRATMCNPAFEDLFQYTSGQVVSADLDSLITAPETAVEADQLTQTVLKGIKVHTVSQRRRRDGTVVDVEIFGIPLLVHGELAGVYALYQDVTERNRARVAIREIAGQFDALQQEERRRLARELHDSTSQDLAVLNWNLNRLLSLVSERSEPLQHLVQDTRDLAARCSASIRTASYLLRPSLLRQKGLLVALPSMVEGFEQRSGIRVDLAVDDGIGRLTEDIEDAVFHIVQEALANVLRHSGSREAIVTLRRTAATLQLCVCDNGHNTARTAMLQPGLSSGVGLASMRERLERLGGCLTIDCDPAGTTLKASVPLPAGCHE
jgi:PAS domain S-box-containing protein